MASNRAQSRLVVYKINFMKLEMKENFNKF